MFDNGFIYVSLICLVVLIAISIYFNHMVTKHGKKEYLRGQDDFFKLLLASGFDSKVNQFKIYNEYVMPEQVVFVGDSITQDYNVYEYFNHLKVYNRGIGGDTTEGLLTRLHESIFDLKPKVVVLLIGTNDIAILKSTPMQIANNIKKIIGRIHSEIPNTKIILQSIYPVSREHNSKIDLNSVNIRDNKIIDQINEYIQSIPDVEYIDVNSHLKDKSGNLKLEYTVEGLHISPLGYKVITQLLEPIILNDMKK